MLSHVFLSPCSQATHKTEFYVLILVSLLKKEQGKKSVKNYLFKLLNALSISHLLLRLTCSHRASTVS